MYHFNRDGKIYKFVAILSLKITILDLFLDKLSKIHKSGHTAAMLRAAAIRVNGLYQECNKLGKVGLGHHKPPPSLLESSTPDS